MALKIRLARHGQTKRPFYRMVVTEGLGPRDGRFIEVVGTYNPMVDPAASTIKEDRVRYWVGVGAKPTLVAKALIEKSIPGFVNDREAHQRTKLQAARKQRKERARSRAA